jgi:mono/diheme cytochrome c family protein
MKFFLLAISLMMLCISCGSAPKTPADELFLSKCSRCHGSQLALEKKKTYEQWLDTIKRMENFGLDISGGERKAIAQYLTDKK